MTPDEIRAEARRWHILGAEHPSWAERADSETRRLELAALRLELEHERTHGATR